MSALALSLTDISLTFGGDPLFDAAALDVGPQARIALVGRNGTGKSTLLKIAAGLVEPDHGERFVHPGLRLFYLPQEEDFGACKTAREYIRRANDDLVDDHQAGRALETFGVAADLSLASLSGGEAKRVGLAAAFASEPDILLLDEPTNHLDIPAIAQLEECLKTMRGALVVISHDRRFLETITNETVWIDRGATRHLSRGFAHFEEWRDKILDEEAASRHKLTRKIAAEEDWVRYGVTARRKRNVRRLGELHAMRKQLKETRQTPGSVKFGAIETHGSGKRVIVAEAVSKSFDGRPIVEDFSIEITRGEKIGIVAPNGTGKTTLLNLLTGQLSPDQGTITIGTNVELTSLDQRRAALKPEMRLADAIADERGDWVEIAGQRKHVATYLQDFLFKPEQWRAPVSSLSGGERGRLALAAALAKPSNLLALDEPTNDLDLETLDLLEDLLADYQGTLLLISHDRSFLDHIVDAIITTDPDKTAHWQRYPGGYDDMVAQRGAAPGEKSAVKPKKETPGKREDAPRRKSEKLSYKEQYALERLPAKIAALEKEISKLTSDLEDPALFGDDPNGFQAKADALDAAKAALSDAEDEWLHLEEKKEALGAS